MRRSVTVFWIKHTLVNGSDVAQIQPESFFQDFSFDGLGNLTNQHYPVCSGTQFTACTSNPNSSPARSQTYTYTQGLLTGLAGPAANATISYFPNLAINQVHYNGQEIWGQGIANNMPRPDQIYISDRTGQQLARLEYHYDAAGNIYQIQSFNLTGGAALLPSATQDYTYDLLGRVVTAAFDPTDTRTHEYDGFGNLKSITGLDSDPSVGSRPYGLINDINIATNRFNTPSVYDNAGNLKFWAGQTYTWDVFNQMTRLQVGSVDSLYLYDANDDRVLTMSLSGGARVKGHWTLRGLGNEVLRIFDATNQANYTYKD